MMDIAPSMLRALGWRLGLYLHRLIPTVYVMDRAVRASHPGYRVFDAKGVDQMRVDLADASLAASHFRADREQYRQATKYLLIEFEEVIERLRRERRFDLSDDFRAVRDEAIGMVTELQAEEREFQRKRAAERRPKRV